jgi:hypothetical protein
VSLERPTWHSGPTVRWRVEIEEGAKWHNLKVVQRSASYSPLLDHLHLSVGCRAKKAQLSSPGMKRPLPIVGLSHANRGRQG